MRVCAVWIYVISPSRYSDIPHRRVQRWKEVSGGSGGGGVLDHTTEIHPAGVGEISNHKQLAHHLTVWVFCFLSLFWEISGALWCWALSIGTLERSVSWLPVRTALCSGIHWNFAPTWLALCAAKDYPAACVGMHFSHHQAVFGSEDCAVVYTTLVYIWIIHLSLNQ